MKTIYSRIYERLGRLGVLDLLAAETQAAKSKSGGFMDLHFDYLHQDEGTLGSAHVVALAHYFEQNGDLCADPDMEIRVNVTAGWAEALTYQQAIPPIYQQVYPEPGLVNVTLKRRLNEFLAIWLKNAIEQGHHFTATAVEVSATS